MKQPNSFYGSSAKKAAKMVAQRVSSVFSLDSVWSAPTARCAVLGQQRMRNQNCVLFYKKRGFVSMNYRKLDTFEL